MGHVLNHNDDIPEDELKHHAKDTQKRWKILRQEEAKKTFLSMLNSKKREEEAKLREKSMTDMHLALPILTHTLA